MLRRAHLVDAGALLLYGVITVVMTWPLVINLSGHTLSGTIDEYMFIWGFWWMGYSLQTLHTWPFHTDMLYHPFGTGLAFHGGLSPIITTLSIPVQNIWSVEVAYNLAILAAFIFSAFSMYLLVNYLVADKRAAFAGGIVFAFSTFKFLNAGGHLHIISTQFFPLYVLFFIKMLRESEHRRRYAAFAGLCLGFIFLVDYYQTVYAIFFSICYLIYYLLGRADTEMVSSGMAWGRRILNKRSLTTLATLLIILGTVFVAVGSPLLYADYKDIKEGYYVKWEGANTFYADAASFFLPINPWVAPHWVQQFNAQIVSQRGGEGLVYAGWVAIVLVIAGSLKLARRSAPFRFWLTFLLICFVFALGPQPHFFNNPLPLAGPYALWAQIPILNNARIPARFALLTTFAAGILVAFTIRSLLNWLTSRWPATRANIGATLLLAAISVLMLIDNLLLPFGPGAHPLDEPPVFAQIAAEVGDFAVLDLPVSGSPRVQFSIEHIMYEQTLYQKRAFSGSISRPLPDFNNYYINDEYIHILSSEPNGTKRADGEIVRVLTDTNAMNFYRLDAARLVYYLDVRYLIVHPPALPVGAINFLNQTLPLVEVYPDKSRVGDTMIYRVDTEAVKSMAETARLSLASPDSNIFKLLGWERPETDTQGGYVWLNRAEGQLLTPVREPANYTVTLTIRPLIKDNQPQTLSIYLNDENAPAATIPLPKSGWQDYRVSIGKEHWRSGLNKMRLRMSYAATPSNGDTRTLSAAFRTITFTLAKLTE